ncbi:MAG TPA: LrgB family protein [Eoetvoesiella sp.]
MRANSGLTWSYLVDSPILWLSVTVVCYLGAMGVYRRFGSNPLLLPALTAVVVVVALLLLTRTPYSVYAKNTQFLDFLIGPATVALAVPLYSQLDQLKQLWRPVLAALLVGSLTAILSALGIAWIFNGSAQTMLSLAPKSATMPIAMEVAQLTGGLPSFTTVAVAITGISGTIMVGGLLRLFRVNDPAIEGFALGLSAHAIGTARAFQRNETAGAFAALAMSLNGIATAVLVPVLLVLLGLF